MLFLLIVSLFIFLLLTPRICFGFAGHNVTVPTLGVVVWATSGTVFATLKWLI